MTSDGARVDAYGRRLLPVRTTVNLDDELLRQAQQLSGIPERTQLLRAALQALVERESARRLVLLGGSDPDLTLPPGRRGEPA
jgi:Arc/MetJ family transcription regulator